MPKIKGIRRYSADERVAGVGFSEDSLTVSLLDGRLYLCAARMVPAPPACHACATCPLEDCRRRIWNPLARYRRGPQHRRLVARRAGSALRPEPPFAKQTNHPVCRGGAGAEEGPHQL